MGEAADDLIEGFCCSWCGDWFDMEHGFPVICGDCWIDDPAEAKKSGMQKATANKLEEDGDQ